MVEGEMRNARFQFLDASSFQAANAGVATLRTELQQAAAAAQQTANAVAGIKVPAGGGGIPGIGGNLQGLLAGGLAGYSAQRLGSEVLELGQLGTQANRTEFAFETLSGSAEKAEARIRAIQRAAGGSVTSLEATEYATQAVALKLADTTAEFSRLTTAARAVALVSPVINDVGSAISEIGLASANTSYRRLDQLGLSVTEVKDRMAELRAETSGLDESQVFLQATVGLLNEKYGEIVNSSVAAATGQEQLIVRLKELNIEIAKVVASGGNEFFERLAVLLGGGSANAISAGLDRKIAALQATLAQEQQLKDQLGGFGDVLTFDPFRDLDVAGALRKFEETADPILGRLASDLRKNLEQSFDLPDVEESQLQRFKELSTAFTAANEALSKGAPGADAFQAGIQDIASSAASLGAVTDQNIADIRELVQAYESGALAQKEMAEQQQQAANSQQAAIADLESAASRIQQLFANVTAAQAAGVPGADQYAASLANLAQEIAIAGAVSDEHGAALAEIDSWYNLVAGSAGTYATAASSLEASQMGAANASYMLAGGLGALPGWLSVIEGGSYSTAAGVDTLTGSLYSLSLQMAQLTAVRSQIGSSLTSQAKSIVGIVGADNAYKLLQRQQGQVQGVVSNLQAQGYSGDALTLKAEEVIQQLAQPFESIKETEKERIRLAQQASRETASGFTKAAKTAEDEFKKAAQQLRSDLSSVPGLFGLSEVTEDQMKMAEAGMPQNFADDYIRRLRDEVENGVDWEGVSVEDAARRIGFDPNLPAEVILREIEAQWRSGALFADKANLELINRDVVNAALEMKEKARQGQENIYEYFGAVIDDAVGAATGGGGGGGGVAPLGAAVIEGIHNDIAKELQATLGAPITGMNIAPLTGAVQNRGFLSSFANPFGGQFPAGQFPYGPLPKPGTEGAQPAGMKVEDYFAFPVPESKIPLVVSDYWEMQQPEEVDLAELVKVTGELPGAVKIDRSKLVQYVNQLPAGLEVDKSALVEFVNQLPEESVNRAELVEFVNQLPGESVDRSELVAFINELPASVEVDRSELVEFLGELPQPEKIERSGLVKFIGSLPFFNVDLSKVVTVTGAPNIHAYNSGPSAAGGGRGGFGGKADGWAPVMERLNGLMQSEGAGVPVMPIVEGEAFATALRGQLEGQSGTFTELGKIPARYMQGGYQSYEWGELGRSFVNALSTQLVSEQAMGAYAAIGEFAATRIVGGYAAAIGKASFIGPLKAKIAAEVMESVADAVTPAPAERQ